MRDVGFAGRRVRGYFAAVNRAAGAPVVFDPAVLGRFTMAPSPWMDLGWCSGFTRTSGTKVEGLATGAPATVSGQVRTELGATVGFEFETWGRLQMGLAAGSQTMNLLATATGAAANGSGGVAASAVGLGAGSTASSLVVGSAASGFGVGDLVAVDVDYVGQVGFVGTGVSGAYVRSAAAVGGDLNYVRRVTFNVGRVTSVSGGLLGLEAPLMAGDPAAGMQVSRMVGFCDREGGSFFPEWSGVFVMDGEQGDRVIFHYPRLQALQGGVEAADSLGGVGRIQRGQHQHSVHVNAADSLGGGAGRVQHGQHQHPVHVKAAGSLGGELERVRLKGAFRALPVVDGNDGETCVCFRSYLPAVR